MVKDLPYREAFFTLSAARTYHMNGPNPIAISEIYSLMMIRGIASVSDMAKYLVLIQRLDQIYLKHSSEKLESANKATRNG